MLVVFPVVPGKSIPRLTKFGASGMGDTAAAAVAAVCANLQQWWWSWSLKTLGNGKFLYHSPTP